MISRASKSQTTQIGIGSEPRPPRTSTGKVVLPRGSSDAALVAYHVDRSKLFAIERLEAINLLDGRASLVPSNSRDSLPASRRGKKSPTRRENWCVPPI